MNQKLGKRKRRGGLAATVRAKVSGQSDQRPYFHGGNASLKVGQYILPPSETGASQNGSVPSHIRGKDHIYMVRDFVEAAPWAAHHQSPIIYQVEPEGNVENDPDVEKPGLSYRCPKAKIVAVHNIPANLLLAAQLELLRR
ncbi:NAD(+)--rifampin ADP-ribosyltransferase [Bradyrhizobium sp. LA7.1]|uniref:NAD(+)--rifampin ADP-ribosyltransferase n=1 Tax=Bradyrhizobium sp. LA7.1 TaxID=3156324 RepID=UPI0033916DA3